MERLSRRPPLRMHIPFAHGMHAYEVLPQEGGYVPVFAYDGLRRWDRTRESRAAMNAAGKPKRHWTVIKGDRNGSAGVTVLVPADKIQVMRDSMNGQGFTEGKTPSL